MRAGVLTDLSVRSLSARNGQRVEIWDGKLPGFGVRVSPKGTKTFVLLYYYNGRKRRETIGRFPLVTLAGARAKALAVLGQAAQGVDPQVTVRSAARPYRFEAVVEEFVETYCAYQNRKSTAYETARLLRARFCPAWMGRDIRHITRADVLSMLDAAVKANTPSAANHALAAVRKLFSWAVERTIIDSNPCAGVSRPAPIATRERVLTDEELAAIWRAADAIGYPMEAIVKLLILTGQRRGEVAGMRWTEIDRYKAMWTIPGERTKNKRTHVLPFPPGGLAVLASVPKTHAELVFPARGSETEALSGFSKLKPRLAARTDVADWTLHDIRRSMATGMAGLGVAPHVVERILNHVSGTFAGVAGIYNRFEYMDEMRAALEAWDTHIKIITAKIADA